MNSHKNCVSFLAAIGRGCCRAVLWATLRRRLGRSLALPVLLLALAGSARVQVNSGSDGQDGAFNPNSNKPPAIPLV